MAITKSVALSVLDSQVARKSAKKKSKERQGLAHEKRQRQEGQKEVKRQQ